MRHTTPILRRTMRVIAAAASISVLVTATHARADQPKSAEALFDEGRRLMKEPGKLSEACRILAESYKLEERGDTLLNLAECHRREGRTATAWSEFDKAMRESEKVGFVEAMQTAKQLRDDLAVKLSTLIVAVPPAIAGLEGLAVEVNGKPWPREQWNKPAYFDPGPAAITAVARGHKRFEIKIVVADGKDQKTVTVALERIPAPKPAPPPPKPVVAKKRQLWPWIVGGAGVGMVGASVAFLVDQQGAKSELDSKCGADRTKCPKGYDFAPARGRELRDFGLFVGLGAAGLVAIGAGGVGLGLAKRGASSGKTSLQISPTSMMLQGDF